MKNQKPLFNPYQYSEKHTKEYSETDPKPLGEMTFDDAALIVIGQARTSDFHDEVVEKACKMLEHHFDLLFRVDENTGERIYIVQ